jgi:LPXTG-motif cell wall-anchored protein
MFKRKKIQRMIIGIISVLMIGIISLQSEKIYSFSNDSYGLELTPSEFHMDNMRPGYVENHTLTVKNTGDLIIKYTVKLSFKSGEKLFKELNVTVKHENAELYKGKLSELTISPRTLPANTNDPLTFSIGLPGEAGNEFQGLTTSFEIQVQGEGEDPPTDGEDPPTDGEDPGEDPGEDDGNNPPDSNTPPQDGNGTPTNPPSKDSGSLPQTGEENPILLILSGVFMSMAGLGLLLIKKSILTNPFRRG